VILDKEQNLTPTERYMSNMVHKLIGTIPYPNETCFPDMVAGMRIYAKRNACAYSSLEEMARGPELYAHMNLLSSRTEVTMPPLPSSNSAAGLQKPLFGEMVYLLLSREHMVVVIAV
jgi:hypothetical protein